MKSIGEGQHRMQPPTLRSIHLPAAAESVAMVREFVQKCCAAWGLDEAADVAVLLASELATNAVRYARSPVVVRLAHRPDRLVLSVEDASGTSAAAREPLPTDEGGRGLVLVNALAERWGESHIDHGKRVWAEIALAPAHTTATPPGQQTEGPADGGPQTGCPQPDDTA